MTAARAQYEDDTGTLDPAIFVVNTTMVSDAERALLDELVDLCQPQTGAAVLLVGGHPGASESIELVGGDRARWLSVTVTAPLVDRDAAAQMAVMFDHAANAPSTPLKPSPVVERLGNTEDQPGSGKDRETTRQEQRAAMLDSGLALNDAGRVEPAMNGYNPDTVDSDSCEAVSDELDESAAVLDESGEDQADREPVAYEYQAPEHDVLVKVLGEVAVEGRPIKSAAEVEMLTLLAMLRDSSPNIDTIRTLLRRQPAPKPGGEDGDQSDDVDLAPDPHQRTMQNRLSRLRTKLGVAADGDTDLLPAAARGRSSAGRYQLSDRVLTDVDLLEHRYRTSLELASHDALVVLRDGLSLMRGPAFRARSGYSWVFPEGVGAKVQVLVNAYATRLMELAMERDDVALVLETVRCAGRVMDDPLAEMPMRDLEREYAGACGDPELQAAVAEATDRLRRHLDVNDPTAPVGE